jgi:uncharacterized protein (DUF427 family)
VNALSASREPTAASRRREYESSRPIGLAQLSGVRFGDNGRLSLTVGTGPFGDRPAGRFNFDPPSDVLFFDDAPGRIRAVFEREVVADSLRAKLLHRTGKLPVYWFPQADVRAARLEASPTRTSDPLLGEATWWSLRAGDRVAPDAAWAYPKPYERAAFVTGHVALVWNAVDEWFCEDEQLFGHPRDPYSRIDVYRTTRHVRISLDGVVLADTRRAKVLFETALPPRWYIPADDVRTDLLVPSSHRTRCAYKGSATHWSVQVGERLVENLLWSYPDPQHDAEPVRDLLAFYDERVDVDVDGARQQRPRTQWG